MSKVMVLKKHTSGNRDSWWYLEQDTDGSLYVRYVNDEDHSKRWRKSINEYMASEGSARIELQALIDRMFEKSAAGVEPASG